jgi:hypothetical protein|uniref:Uncharacterized protein n=1 Tax=Picea glauca TaxID=3330 RepID=A0A101M141_PICGL|nr:hypothetical protein ABT39_MTgene3655 [Picea glauca]
MLLDQLLVLDILMHLAMLTVLLVLLVKLDRRDMLLAQARMFQK